MPKDSSRPSPLFCLRLRSTPPPTTLRTHRGRTYRPSTPQTPSPLGRTNSPSGGGSTRRLGQNLEEGLRVVAGAPLVMVANDHAHVRTVRDNTSPNTTVETHQRDAPGEDEENFQEGGTLLAGPSPVADQQATPTLAPSDGAELQAVDCEDAHGSASPVRRGTRIRRAPRRIVENALPLSPIAERGFIARYRGVYRPMGPSLDEQKALRNEYRAAKETIGVLRREIHRLESSEHRLKGQLHTEKERLKDTRVEVEESRSALVLAEEKLDDAERSRADLIQDVNRFRGWWITENHSLKAILTYVPKRKRDAGLEAVVHASSSRFMTYTGMGSN